MEQSLWLNLISWDPTLEAKFVAERSIAMWFSLRDDSERYVEFWLVLWLMSFAFWFVFENACSKIATSVSRQRISEFPMNLKTLGFSM